MSLEAIALGSKIAQGVANTGLSVWESLFRERQYKEQKQREDTAAQRRVADLRAAGLSPTLAAGSAAQSSTPISVTAPRVSLDTGIQEYQSIRESKQNIATARQAELASRQNVWNAQAEAMLKNQALTKSAIDIEKAAEELSAQKLANRAAEYNFNLAQRYGIRSDISSGLVGQLQQGTNVIARLLESLGRDGSVAANAARDNIKQGSQSQGGAK